MMLDDEDVASFVASIVVSLSNSSIIPKHGFEIMLQFQRCFSDVVNKHRQVSSKKIVD